MAKPRKSVSNSDVFRSDLEELYTASLLTGQNAQTITVPGWGKTKLSLHMGRQVVGHDSTLLIECNPALQPDRIRGVTDIQAMLKTGDVRRIVDGTPYDPNCYVCILDEVGRLSDIAFDLLIHATNDYLRPVRPVFWGTSNFAVKGQRTEAFRDRFALNYIPTLQMDELSVLQVAGGSRIEDMNFNLPDGQAIMDVRNMVPTQASSEAVTALVVALYRAVISTTEGKDFVKGLNPRRVEAWKDILFRVSAYYHGTNDFQTVHPAAAKVMRFAFPVQDPVEYSKWVAISAAVIDPAATAIETIRAEAYQKMVEIQSARGRERQEKMVELGRIKAEAEMALGEFGNDARSEEAIEDLQKLFIAFAQGKDALG
jgi:MoxR-like ATPase